MRLIRFAITNATPLCKATETKWLIVPVFQFWHLLRESPEWVGYGQGIPQALTKVKSMNKALHWVTNGIIFFVECCFTFQMYSYSHLSLTSTHAIAPILKAPPTTWRFLPLVDPQVEVTFNRIPTPRGIIHINIYPNHNKYLNNSRWRSLEILTAGSQPGRPLPSPSGLISSRIRGCSCMLWGQYHL